MFSNASLEYHKRRIKAYKRDHVSCVQSKTKRPQVKPLIRPVIHNAARVPELP